jgi:hypothetical protein
VTADILQAAAQAERRFEMRVHQANGNGTGNPSHPHGHIIYGPDDGLSSLGTRSTRGPLNGNVGSIHQFQASHISGASKQDTAVLRHANRAHNMANARDPVVMNILKRTQAQRPVSPQEEKMLAARLLYNEKRLAALNAHKHPADVSYQLIEKPDGDSRIQELVNGKPLVSHQTGSIFSRH